MHNHDIHIAYSSDPLQGLSRTKSTAMMAVQNVKTPLSHSEKPSPPSSEQVHRRAAAVHGVGSSDLTMPSIYDTDINVPRRREEFISRCSLGAFILMTILANVLTAYLINLEFQHCSTCVSWNESLLRSNAHWYGSRLILRMGRVAVTTGVH